MAALPIAARESRIVCRRVRTYVLRSVIAGCGILGVLVSLWIARYDSTEQGNAVFLGIGFIAQIYALFAGVIVAADAIAAERREQTLGLLFLTDLRPHQVLLGKWIAVSTNALFGLMAVIPLLAVPLLMGGVSVERFALLALTLLNSLFLSLSVGFLFSSLFKSGWLALCIGVSWALLMGVIAPLLAEWNDWNAGVYFLMPSAGYIAIFDAANIEEVVYWQAVIFNHIVAWGALAMAAARLIYVWKDRPRTWQQQRWFNRFLALRYGAKRARQKLRANLLDQNPLSWLVNREQVSSSGLLLVFTMLFAGAGLLMLFSSNFLETSVVYGIGALFIAHAALLFRMSLAAAYLLAEDRRSGALELLLSTPIKVREIIRGRWLGLFRQFLGPIAVVLVFHGLVLEAANWRQNLISHFYVNAMQLPKEVVFYLPAMLVALLPLVWIAAGWCGMWFGLRFRKAASAVWATLAVVVIVPVGLIGMACVAARILEVYLISWEMLTALNFLGAIFIFGALYNGVLMHVARWKLERYFRDAAADRFLEFTYPFPWKLALRGSIGFACAVSLLTALFLGRRALNLHRSEVAWVAARAAHADFSISIEDPDREFFPATIPAEENLAQCQLLKPLSKLSKKARDDDERRSLLYREEALAIYQLSFPSDPKVDSAGRVVPPVENLHYWATGALTPLEPLELYLRRSNQITNRAGSPARSILEFYGKDLDKLIDELEREAKLRPRTQFAQWPEILPAINKAISIRAMARMRIGEPAMDDILLMLRLAEGAVRLGRPIEELVIPVLQPIFEGLAQRRWSDAELEQIQGAIASLDLWSVENTYLRECVRSVIRDQDEPIRSLDDGFYNGFRWKYIENVPVENLRTKTRLLEFGAGEVLNWVDTNKHQINLRRIIERTHDPVADQMRENYFRRALGHIACFAHLQTTLDQIRIACAVERYRQAKGRFPNILDSIAPDYISEVPNDIMTGRPMIYRPTEERDQYELYSVGWNGVDNNGRIRADLKFLASDIEDRNADWVWNPLR